jgi:hypothetical protein
LNDADPVLNNLNNDDPTLNILNDDDPTLNNLNDVDPILNKKQQRPLYNYIRIYIYIYIYTLETACFDRMIKWKEFDVFICNVKLLQCPLRAHYAQLSAQVVPNTT